MSDLKMPDVREIYLCGRLTRDPELKYVPSKFNGGGQVALCKFSVACGNKTETLFAEIEAWDKLAERCNTELSKGRPVMIRGKQRTEKWESTSGEKRSSTRTRAYSVTTLDWDSNKPVPEPVGVAEDDIPF